MIDVGVRVQSRLNGAIGIVEKVYKGLDIAIVRFEDDKVTKVPFHNLEELSDPEPSGEIKQVVTITKEDFHDLVIRVSSPLYIQEVIYPNNEDLKTLANASILISLIGERLEALIYEEGAY